MYTIWGNNMGLTDVVIEKLLVEYVQIWLMNAICYQNSYKM